MGARPGVHKRHHRNLNHWSTGWTDWNLVLDMNGGDRFDFGFFYSDFVNNAMDITMMLTQVQIGQIILLTRQSLSTATLTSSTSSRCTTPLLTSGGDSFERSFLNLFHRSKFLPEASYRVGLTAEGYDADRVQVSTLMLCSGGRNIFFRSREVFQL